MVHSPILLSAETAAEMTHRGPRALLKTVEGVGHAPMLMSEDQIALVRDFWKATECSKTSCRKLSGQYLNELLNARPYCRSLQLLARRMAMPYWAVVSRYGPMRWVWPPWQPSCAWTSPAVRRHCSLRFPMKTTTTKTNSKHCLAKMWPAWSRGSTNSTRCDPSQKAFRQMPR